MRKAALLLLTSLLLATPTRAQEAAPRTPRIAVTGTGEVELRPDFARLNVAVITEADTLAQATGGNRAASDRVLARMQAAGVKREDIRTTNLQVFPSPERVGPDGREVKVPRFTAQHHLEIRTRDVDGVGRLAGEILAVDGIAFQSLSWGLDRQDQGADEARRKAVEDARRQAGVYAGAAGASLGRLMEIRDGTVQPHEDPMPRMAASRAESLPVIPPASLRYTATVQMVWELAP